VLELREKLSIPLLEIILHGAENRLLISPPAWHEISPKWLQWNYGPKASAGVEIGFARPSGPEANTLFSVICMLAVVSTAKMAPARSRDGRERK
jgi:hypothetical protein